jgi:hypothetical protein
MIPRYSPAEFAACRAMEAAGLVPAGTADKVSSFRAQLDADAIDEIEKVTRHDVIAFLTHVEGIAGEPARWLHRGMTSSDVLDSSLALLLVEATDKLLVRLDAVLEALRGRIEEHRRTPGIGRSHGIHAEPVTFGLILAGHYAELARGRQRLLVAREEIAVGKIAGAVGTYAHLTPAIEAEALGALGLRPETASTQVVARDRHAAYVALFDQCSSLAAHRGRRSRRALQERPEGLERHAAQAESRSDGEPLRSRTRRAGSRRPGPRKRGALARAGHQPFVGGAHDAAGRDGDAYGRTSIRPVGSGRAKASCSRSLGKVSAGRTRMCSSRETR